MSPRQARALPARPTPPVYHPPVTEPGDYVKNLGGVGVFHWNPARGADDMTLGLVGNFGDLLGPLVVERMLWRRSPLRPVSESADRRLFSIGSVLHLARSEDVVWGAGVNGKAMPTPLSAWPQLDIRAVRGPWTARLLTTAGLRVPSVFGDPALLVARLFPELGGWARCKVHDTLVIPNFNDVASYQDADHEVLLPTEPVWTVLRSIAKSHFVVGSSLHAIAVADALGVPARFVASEHEHSFKFRDYLAGTGRPTTRIATSVQHALDLGPHRAPVVDLDALERAFPWDLWSVAADEALEAPDEFVPGAMQAAWIERMERGGGSSEVVSHFLNELLPAIRRAAVDGVPELESLVSQACDFRTEVCPEVSPESLDDDSRRLVKAIESRDATLVRVTSLLGASWPVAMLRGVRHAGNWLIIGVVLHNARVLAAENTLVLVLTGQSTGRVVRQPVTLFELQRRQWHVDLDVMVDTALLKEDETWTLAVESDGPEPASLGVISASAESLGLLALERGDLPTPDALAIISKDGKDRFPTPLAVGVS